MKHNPATLKPLLRCFAYLKSHKWIAAAAFLCLALSSLINLSIPRITQIVIDSGISVGNLRVVFIGAGLIIAISLGKALFTFLQGYLAARVSQGVAFDMRNHIYEQIQHLSFSYHDRSQTGQLLTRATSDVDLVRIFIGMGVIQLLNAVLMLSGSMILLFIMNWRLTLITIPIIMLGFFILVFFVKKGRPLFVKVQQKLAKLNIRLQENITGIRVVKAFARESFEIMKFERGNLELKNISIRVRKLFAIAMPLIFSISNLSTLAVVWAGGYQVFAGHLTIGELVAFQSYLMMSMFPVMMLGMLTMQIAQASAGAIRVFEILDAKSEVKEKPGAINLPVIEGKLIFDNVTFRYFKGSEPVLESVSFTAQPGQTIALLGATGSGKSTIINLIPRFYDVSEGKITVDGYDIRDITLESLRKQIGIVLQEVILFGGTIRENIAYGKLDARDEEIIEAAKTSNAHEFITSFAKGYDTPIGERGVTLSGGQKQRIAIARALLVDPRILILDDSTSSVDFATETKIQNALARLKKGRLCFIIAMRISTVKTADQILVLDKGKIVAMGSHETLIDKSPLYADIYYSQLEPDKVTERERR